MDQNDREQLRRLGQHLWRTPAHIEANEYQELAMRSSVTHDSPDHRLINAALGIVGEAGEIANPIGVYLNGDLLVERLLTLAGHVGLAADHIKKARYHGKPIDYRHLNLLCTAVRQGAELLAVTAGNEMVLDNHDPAGVSIHQIEDGLPHELGDLAWYLAQACDSRGWHLGDILRGNIDKLRARWPEGFRREDGQRGPSA